MRKVCKEGNRSAFAKAKEKAKEKAKDYISYKALRLARWANGERRYKKAEPIGQKGCDCMVKGPLLT
jgi:hypothetical protein